MRHPSAAQAHFCLCEKECMTPPSRQPLRRQVEDAAALGSSMRERIGGLLARAATRTGEGADRLREAARELRRPALLQQALAAQERGNLEAAYWLLQEEYRDHPEHPAVAVAFWNVAATLERAQAAAPAAAWLVERHSAEGETELAGQFFSELCGADTDTLVTPTAVVRMLPALRQRVARADAEAQPAEEALLRRALHQAVDPRNPMPSPGLAFRIFKEARELAPDAARRAAELALASPDLHEAKRDLLQRWLGGAEDAEMAPAAPEPPASQAKPTLKHAEPQASQAEPTLEHAEPTTTRAEPMPGHAEPTATRAEPMLDHAEPTLGDAEALADDAESLAGDAEALADDAESLVGDAEPPADDGEPRLLPLSEEQVARAAERLPPPGPPTPPHELRALAERGLLNAVPIAFGAEALELRLPGGRESRLGWREIQAVAVADVAGMAAQPVTLVDFILNWRRRGSEPLRVVRLRVDAFEPKCLVDDAGEDPLETFLAELLERSHAVPLPDPESALGLRRSSFASLADYEREVLGES